MLHPACLEILRRKKGPEQGISVLSTFDLKTFCVPCDEGGPQRRPALGWDGRAVFTGRLVEAESTQVLGLGPCRAPGAFPAAVATPGSTTGTDPHPKQELSWLAVGFRDVWEHQHLGHFFI